MKGFLPTAQASTNFACYFLSRSKMVEDVVTVENESSKSQSVLHYETL